MLQHQGLPHWGTYPHPHPLLAAVVISEAIILMQAARACHKLPVAVAVAVGVGVGVGVVSPK